MKRALLTLALFAGLLGIILLVKILIALTAKPTVKVDYLTEWNRITRPSNYDPNQNAAPYYEKAFETLIELPEEIEDKWRFWPADMNETELRLAENWRESNLEAFDWLRKAVEKPYYWVERQAEDNAMFNIEIIELEKYRKCCHGSCFYSRLLANEDEIESALLVALDIHKMGVHYSGPLTLVEQLVGLAVRHLAYETALQVLSRKSADVRILTSFQKQLELQIQRKKPLNFSGAENLYLHDWLQRNFTDDGEGDGRVIALKLYEQSKESLFQEPLSFIQAFMIASKHPGRKQTLDAAKQMYEKLNSFVYVSPWEMHIENTSYQERIKEIIGDNYSLNTSSDALAKIVELYHRGEISGQATLVVAGILKYKAEKGHYPDILAELKMKQYISELPRDPYGPGVLVYENKGDDFILYSFGADFKGDGGQVSKWGQEPKGGDQVFWPPNEGE